MFYELLELDSSVPIGSRALGVANAASDYDICILSAELTMSAIPTKGFKYCTIYDCGYKNSILLRQASLYTMSGIDIFVFTDPRQLDLVRDAMVTMERWPKFLLRKKWFRVWLFRKLLIDRGF